MIDGSVLLGGFQTTLKASEIYLFALGLAAASSLWFLVLSATVNSFRSALTPRTMLFINRFCGVALLVLGARLVLSLVEGT